jgi:hypothetical protein
MIYNNVCRHPRITRIWFSKKSAWRSPSDSWVHRIFIGSHSLPPSLGRLISPSSGDLSDGWAEALLSEQFQVSGSLTEECEAVGEARPPLKVAWFGVFIGAAMGVFCWSNVRAEGSTIMCVQLVGDSPWWRSSGGHLSLRRVAASSVAQHWTMAWVAVAYFWLFSEDVVM